VVFGPSLNNVKEAAEYIVSNNYGTRVELPEELTALVELVYEGKKTFKTRSENDVKISATVRTGDYILEKLKNV